MILTPDQVNFVLIGSIKINPVDHFAARSCKKRQIQLSIVVEKREQRRETES